MINLKNNLYVNLVVVTIQDGLVNVNNVMNGILWLKILTIDPQEFCQNRKGK